MFMHSLFAVQVINGSTAPTTPIGYNNTTTTTTVLDNEDNDENDDDDDNLTDPAPTSATPITTDGNNGNNNSSSNTINTISNNATNSSSSNTLWQFPQCELVCTRPELCDTIQNKNIQLVLAVDVICRKGNCCMACVTTDVHILCYIYIYIYFTVSFSDCVC